MYSADNEGKSIDANKFISNLKSKIYKTMTATDSKSYLGYLNRLVDKYNNIYHRSIGKKPVDTDYSALTEKIKTNSKFKNGGRMKITK